MSSISLRDRIAILFGATPQSLEEARSALKKASEHKLQEEVTRIAVRDLFERRYFDICKVDTLMKLHGSVLCSETSKAYDMMRTLHCVDYGKMPRDVIQALPGLVMAVVFPEKVLAEDAPQEKPLAVVKTIR